MYVHEHVRVHMLIKIGRKRGRVFERVREQLQLFDPFFALLQWDAMAFFTTSRKLIFTLNRLRIICVNNLYSVFRSRE